MVAFYEDDILYLLVIAESRWRPVTKLQQYVRSMLRESANEMQDRPLS